MEQWLLPKGVCNDSTSFAETLRCKKMRFCQVAMLLFLVAGCKPEKPAQSSQSKEARARATAVSLQKEDKARQLGSAGQNEEDKAGKSLSDDERSLVVAKIGDYEVTLGDVERQIRQQPVFARARYRLFEKKVEFLHNLVQFELLAMQAHEKGYDTDPEVVLATKRAMVQKFISNDLNSMVKVSTISDAEISRYYENNKSLFQKSEQVRVSHILFDDEAEAGKTKIAIDQAIESDRPRARVIFSEFARRKSTDRATAYINGDLNFFARDGYVADGANKGKRLAKTVVEAAFALTHIGTVSPVVKSDKGYHIIQITNRRPAINRKLDQARRQITNTLLRQKKDKARQAYIDGLKAKATVEIFEENLKKLKVDTDVEMPKLRLPTKPNKKATKRPKGLPSIHQLVRPDTKGSILPKEAIQKRGVQPNVGPKSDARPKPGTRP
jgi:peptidyl-prolyl cis-trans isomerase C